MFNKLKYKIDNNLKLINELKYICFYMNKNIYIFLIGFNIKLNNKH